MALFSNARRTKVANGSSQDDWPALSNSSKTHESHLISQEEEEEEDVDFNPFLKETPSPEASSSLSSEIEGLDGDVDIMGKMPDTGGFKSSNLNNEVQNFDSGDYGHGEEEIVMKTTFPAARALEMQLQTADSRNLKLIKSSFFSQPENGTGGEQDNGSSCATDVNDVTVGGRDSTKRKLKPIMEVDYEDAICTRTRARYSLASFTLDELETFLQETDDEDDLQNVDDDEEYKKFLAAVLHGGEGDNNNQENENVDDEDEDNDADFEIELEEALESDLDESLKGRARKDCKESGRRPETRQNKRQKATDQYTKRLPGQTKRTLRPLLPILPNGPIAATCYGKTLNPANPPSSQSSIKENDLINGFTPHQIGQLYCLIYQHVQLLVQVFSLCVHDSSRQHIASLVQGLIAEMLHKRDEVLSWKTMPYPSICFCPSCLCPSVPYEVPQSVSGQCTSESSPSVDALRVCSQSHNQIAAPQNLDPNKELTDCGLPGQLIKGSLWVPFISGPVISTLDVAPLNLARRYMDDVCTAIQESRRRRMECSPDTHLEREPLFPLPTVPSFARNNSELPERTSSPSLSSLPSPPSQQLPKKTLAATLVESTKKNSVAFVPKEIAKLAQGFFPLFNPALYPRKPPPAAVVNRVLFTDAEDELLALGLMEYNTDWKAIQQRFLPCKSKHQIFVRQKNRCSSKASENPIKAVRRMKTSPLTVEEIAHIREGLRVYKSDWVSVWKFVVPHRDPSLLPRQWRIALGTQRSYKQDPEKKEKRRLYESERRKRKAAKFANWQYASDGEGYESQNAGGANNSGENYMENAGNGSVLESSADRRASISIEHPGLNLTERNLPVYELSHKGPHAYEQTSKVWCGEAQPQTGNMDKLLSASKCFQHPSSLSTAAGHSSSSTMIPNHRGSDVVATQKSPFYFRPYRGRRANSAHWVKLAPDLPPVNLPPSVRVVSQLAFKEAIGGAPFKASDARGKIGDTGAENIVSRVPHFAHSVNARINRSNLLKDTNRTSLENNVTNLHPEKSRIGREKCVVEERGADSEFHMHPLLFQASSDGCLPYYPLNCSPSSSFSFFSGNQPQLNLSLLHNPHPEYHADCLNRLLKSKESSSTSCGIDFHPLLQRTEDMNNESLTACSNGHVSVHSGGRSANFENSFSVVQPQLVNCSQLAMGTKTCTSSKKATDLDLEMHLSSLSGKEEVSENKDATMHDLRRSKLTAPNSETIMKNQNISSRYRLGATCPAISGELVSSGHAMMMIHCESSSTYIGNDVGEFSHPEIIMEQEELSDTDEEIEENVEFEREEMTDSEGEEGSGCEQIAEPQNKEDQNLALEEDSDPDKSTCKTETPCDPQASDHLEGQ